MSFRNLFWGDKSSDPGSSHTGGGPGLKAAFKAARAKPGQPQKVRDRGNAGAPDGITYTVTSNHRGDVRVVGSDGTDVTYPPGGGPT